MRFETKNFVFDVEPGNSSSNPRGSKRLDTIYKRAKETFSKPQVRRRIKWTAVLSLILVMIFGYFVFDQTKKTVVPEPARAQSLYNVTGGALINGTAPAVSATNMGSWRGALASDNIFWAVTRNTTGFNAYVDFDGAALNGANKLILTTETKNVTTGNAYFIQVCDWVNSASVNSTTDNGIATPADAQCTTGGWRTLNNPRATGFTDTADNTKTFELYDGFFQTGTAPGTPISTPLTNFVNSGKVRVRFYSNVNSTVVFNIDRAQLESAVDPVYYPASYTAISPFAGTVTNGFNAAISTNNTRQTVTNTAGNAMNFYYSFKNVTPYSDANTILVSYEGAYVSATTLTYDLAICNFTVANCGAGSTGWEDLHTGAITASAASTDQFNYFAKNNVTVSNYISSGEVRIRIYSTVTGTQTFGTDQVYITVGSVNADAAKSETSFGTANATTATNTRDIDALTTATGGNTWQTVTTTTATAPYASDWAGTWGTNYSASTNVSVPITVPQNAQVTGVRYAARFRSNVTTNAVQLGIKDHSGQFAGPTIAGGWTAVGTTNALTTYGYTDGVISGPYQVNPQNYIDTTNNLGNLRLRTSTSTATATATRDWDFAFMSIRWANMYNPATTAQSLYNVTGGALINGTAPAVSATNMGSWRGALASDNIFWAVTRNTTGFNAYVDFDGAALNGANKLILTTETKNVTTGNAYFIQVCDWVNSASVNSTTDNGIATPADAQCTTGGWRTLNNPRATGFTDTADNTKTFELYDGFFQTGTAPGTPISTPLTNFVNSGKVRVRFYSNVNSTVVFNIDRAQLESAVDPVYYPASYTAISPFAGTVTNGFNAAISTNNTRQTVTNTAGNAMNFYYSFKNVTPYSDANTILVSYEGAYVSATTLTYDLAICNFTVANCGAGSTGWEDLHTGAITASAASTDQFNYFAKNNVTVSNYISSGEVRIRIYSTVTGTQTFGTDQVYITVGSVNADAAKSETSFGTANATTATNTRDIDALTTATGGNTWQTVTTTTATAPYASDWAGTWGTNYSASTNVSVPITVPQNAQVTGVRYAARFRSNVTTNAVQLGIKDHSGQFAGPTIAGGWTAVGTTNALTTYGYTDGVISGPYQVNPQNYIDTTNNLGNLRLRTSTSTATATATRDWDFAFMSIRWANAPVVSVGTSGTMTTNVAKPSTGNYAGAAFTAQINTGSTNLYAVTIKETGTIAANTNLSNIKLFYENGSCVYNGTESQFGATGSFDANSNITFTGTATIDTTQSCFYVVYDVASGAVTGDTILFQIANPVLDFDLSQDLANPTTAVTLSGPTTVSGGGNQNPTTPTSPTQGTTSGGTEITESAWTNDNTPFLGFTVSDPDAGDTVKYHIQIATDAAFTAIILDYNPTTTSANPTTFAYNVGQAGNYTTGSPGMTLGDLAGGYWWRVYGVDNNSAESLSPLYFGTQATMDLKVDATAPTGLSVYDGTVVGVDQDNSGTALNSMAANWTAANFNVSGAATPNKYQYAIGTTVGGTEILGWTATNTEGSVVTANSLNINTSTMYYWTVKATDLVGNVTTVTSNGQMVLPTLSFSVDTPTVTFTDLGGSNNWTDTKQTTITTQTNALGGYSVQGRILQLLTEIIASPDTIANWTGTYASPSTWSGSCVGNSQCGFGYTSSDANITTGSRGNMYNSGANYCSYSLSSPGDVVADSNGPTIDGSRNLVNEIFTLTHKVSVNQNQTAGKYQTTLMLIVTSNY